MCLKSYYIHYTLTIAFYVETTRKKRYGGIYLSYFFYKKIISILGFIKCP